MAGRRLAIDPRAVLASLAAPQAGRAGLWLPVVMIFGAAGAISAANPPAAWAPSVVLVLATLASFACFAIPARGPARMALLGLAGAGALTAASALGVLAAQIRVFTLARPTVAIPLETVQLEGRIVAVAAGSRQPRVLIALDAVDGAPTALRRVRLSSPDPPSPGRIVRCRARLFAPEPPLTPFSYDAPRRAFFERLDATGFSLGRCRPIRDLRARPILERMEIRLAGMREDLSRAIQAAAPGQGGALAAALIAGDRAALSGETAETFQNSGLGHLLSVSGLHMALVAGIAFTSALWALALIPGLALRAPLKKLAAGFALAATAGYFVISGASVPAERAFVMSAVALVAVLIDRPAFSLRALGLAAALIVLTRPEAALDPGFQMSFAATLALIAAFEAISARSRATPVAPGAVGPIIWALQSANAAIGAAMVTSLVAGLAVDPIAAHHFQRFAVFGLPANLAAAPIISLWVAPAAALAAIAAPFGLAEGPLQAMAAGLDQVRAIALAFGGGPGAVRALPATGAAPFALLMLAIVWGCVWRGRLRAGAVGFVLAAAGVWLVQPQPVLLADPTLSIAYVRTDEPGAGGWRRLSAGRASAFDAARLAQAAGLDPARAAELPAPAACAEGAPCAFTLRGGARLAFAPKPQAARLQAPCAGASVILSPDPTSVCPGAMAATPAGAGAGGFVVSAGRNGRLRLERGRPAAHARPWSRAGPDPALNTGE